MILNRKISISSWISAMTSNHYLDSEKISLSLLLRPLCSRAFFRSLLTWISMKKFGTETCIQYKTSSVTRRENNDKINYFKYKSRTETPISTWKCDNTGLVKLILPKKCFSRKILEISSESRTGCSVNKCRMFLYN